MTGSAEDVNASGAGSGTNIKFSVAFITIASKKTVITSVMEAKAQDEAADTSVNSVWLS